MTSEYEPKVNTHIEGESLVTEEEAATRSLLPWDGVFDYERALEEIATEEEDEWDFPEGTTCNPDAPEECESCQ